jgi:putative ABC transport system permease protein
MISDLRVTLRGFLRTPLFAVIAILSLALGIGANTAIFSLLDQVLLRTLPVRNPSELVFLYSPGPIQGGVSTDEPGGPAFSYPMFRELQKHQAPFSGLAGAKNDQASLSYKNNASLGLVRMVSGNYFDLLGVRPAIGRLFTEEDDGAPGAHPLAILSYGYWSERFGSDISVLNQTILVNGFPLTVVGVAQKGFTSERLGNSPNVYAPASMREQVIPEWKGLADRKSYWITLVGRLKPGVTLARAQTEINVTYRTELAQDILLLTRPKPDFLERFKARTVLLKPGEHGRGTLRDQQRQPLLLLIGMTGLVLLIACANVANLQLARNAARAREVSVRLALGASRVQLIRQLLAESCILAIAGGALGLIAAGWTLRATLASVPASRGLQGFLSVNLGWPVLLFCLGLSILTGVLFGLFPALQASSPDLVTALKNQAGQVSSGSANAFRKSLVTVQIGVSLLLLISAGLFARTLSNLQHVELGIRTDHLMTFSLAPKLNRYTDTQIAAFHQQLTEKLSAIPGVKLVSSSEVPAIAGSTSSTTITVEGYQAGTDDGTINSDYSAVGADYFRTLGTPLAAGREFSSTDNPAALKVAIVNEAFAKQYFQNQNPLGRHLRRADKSEYEIVGVVRDAKYASMKEPPPPVFYTSLSQAARFRGVFYYLRTEINPDQTASLIRREVAALDPAMPVRDMKTMEAQIDENTYNERLMSVLTGSFAGLATLLAAIGLYGVLAFNVARRTREIGIRMALGAEAAHVRGLVVREVMWMLAIGTAAGIGGAAAAGRVVQSYLYQMKAWDLLVYGSAAAVLWMIAVAAAYIPSRRATNVDPMVALRYE